MVGQKPNITKCRGDWTERAFVCSQQPWCPCCGGVAVQQPLCSVWAGGGALAGCGARWERSLRQGTELGTAKRNPTAGLQHGPEAGGVRMWTVLYIFLPSFDEGSIFGEFTNSFLKKIAWSVAAWPLGQCSGSGTIHLSSETVKVCDTCKQRGLYNPWHFCAACHWLFSVLFAWEQF